MAQRDTERGRIAQPQTQDRTIKDTEKAGGAPRAIRAVLLDMDGLLIDSERVYARAVQAACERLGFCIPMSRIVRALGVDGKGTDAIFSEGVPDYDGAALRREMGEYLRAGGYDRRMPMKEWADGILRSLSSRGVPFALVTSSPLSQADKYLGKERLALFSAVVTGDLGLPCKPAPDGFIRAARLLGADPRDCAVLEDSPSGLMAGRAAGAFTVMVPDLAPYCEELAPYCDRVARSLREAEAIVCP